MSRSYQQDIELQRYQGQFNTGGNRATHNVDPRHWQAIFNKYDTNKDGVLSLSEMRMVLRGANYAHDLPDDAVAKIIDLADHNRDGHLHFKEFLHLVHSEELPEGTFSHLLNVYVHNLIAPRGGRMWHDVVDGQYEEEYSCYPPPIAMLVVALIVVTYTTEGPLAVALIYNPYKRVEAWRFFTYMFVHVGAMHLIVNMLVLLMLGIPLEMVHHWWRVLIVYLAGVLAGSLGTSVTDPDVFLAGASGGVYAIMTAHLATIIMNWSEMSFAIWQLLVFLLLMVVDVGTAIYQRYVVNDAKSTQIGYMAHFAGGIAGLLVGIYVLKNLQSKSWEKKLWWFSVALFLVLLVICVVWNVAFPDYFPKEMM
ncbi:hypothetical protein B566_EDAN002959 [Ephemera danica]|nr:hypothetical protein B566_EDAN002959 [Ephemera danica]